jgi:hypothetical protein
MILSILRTAITFGEHSMGSRYAPSSLHRGDEKDDDFDDPSNLLHDEDHDMTASQAIDNSSVVHTHSEYNHYSCRTTVQDTRAAIGESIRSPGNGNTNDDSEVLKGVGSFTLSTPSPCQADQTQNIAISDVAGMESTVGQLATHDEDYDLYDTFHSLEKLDKIVSRELYRMDPAERDQIVEEIHGVRSMAPVESPEGTLVEALKQFQIEIDLVPMTEKLAYQEAVSHNCQYVLQDEDLRLQFLRAHQLHAKKASVAFLTHLQLLLKYFGRTGLSRPLRYDDLCRPERDLLSTGCIQVLPSRDRSGRRVLVQMFHSPNMKRMMKKSPFAVTRVFLYVYSVIARDVDTQRNGVTCICIPPDETESASPMKPHQQHNKGNIDPAVAANKNENSRSSSLEVWRSLSDLFQHAVPFRFVAIHLFVPSTHVSPIVSEGIMFFLHGKEQFVRFRVHRGK